MSEQFEAGLRDLYTAAEMAHDARPGLAVDLMVARTRRHRRARAAAVTMATAAAVVGVAVAGIAAVNNLGGTTAPPADGPTATTPAEPAVETVGTMAALTCGSTIADLRVPVTPPALVDVEPSREVYAAGEWVVLRGEPSLAVTGDGPGEALPGAGDALTYDFVVATGGIVVATTEQHQGLDLALQVVPCDRELDALPTGSYELYGAAPISVGDVDVSLTGGPWPFTVSEPAPLPDPRAHYVSDGASAVPPSDPTAPLPDGDYLALVSGVDAAAGTVSADVVVLYFGTAAEEWVAANAPGTEILDGYVSDDPDGQTDRVIPLATDTPVWEVCWGPNEEKVRRTGGVAEWATAPIEDGESLCSDTSTIPMGGLYWLDVRGGVIAQVVGQFVP